MDDALLSLRRLRQDWADNDTLEAEETRILRAMTVQESLQQWLALQRAFEWQLQQTASIFAADRQQALADLQDRLQRLAEYQKLHGQSVPIRPTASIAPE